MPTDFPTSVDSAAKLANLRAYRHIPAQFDLYLESLADAVIAAQTKAGVTGAATQYATGAAAGSTILGFGSTAAEGLQLLTVEQTISFAANDAFFKVVTFENTGPLIVLSAQLNIQAALTGGSTTVKVGLGTEADPDLFGLTAALTKNSKITTIPDWAVITTATPIRVSSCASNGTEGDTALTVGSVRVRLVVLHLLGLVNA